MGWLEFDFLLVVQVLINKFNFLFLIMDLCLASLVMHLFLINALTDFTPGLKNVFPLDLILLIIFILVVIKVSVGATFKFSSLYWLIVSYIFSATGRNFL